MFTFRISKIIKKRVTILAFFLVGLLLPFNIYNLPASSEGNIPIKIGVVMPLSGSSALQGNYCLDAIKLAAEEVNDRGGINGIKVEIIAEDDKSVPVESVNAVTKLIFRDNVLAIIGAYNSSCTLANKEVIGKEKIVLITPVSVAEAITKESNPYMFRNCATQLMLGGGFAKYMVEQDNVESIAMLLGRGADEITSGIFKEYDREIVTTEYFSIGDTDFYSQLTKIKLSGVKNILIVGEIQETALIVKQANEIGFHPQFYSYSNANYPEFLALTGNASDGLKYVVSFVSDAEIPEVVRFVNAFKTKYDRIPDMMSADAYDAANVVIEAISKAGTEYENLSLWREKIRDAMYETSYVGVHGPVEFDETGQAEVTPIIIQIKESEKFVVYP